MSNSKWVYEPISAKSLFSGTYFVNIGQLMLPSALEGILEEEDERVAFVDDVSNHDSCISGETFLFDAAMAAKVTGAKPFEVQIDGKLVARFYRIADIESVELPDRAAITGSTMASCDDMVIRWTRKDYGYDSGIYDSGVLEILCDPSELSDDMNEELRQIDDLTTLFEASCWQFPWEV
jgi:hypothetical protein